MDKKYVKQQNYTRGGKTKTSLYFMPSFIKDLREVCQSKNIGMSFYIEENLRKQLSADKRKINSKT